MRLPRRVHRPDDRAPEEVAPVAGASNMPSSSGDGAEFPGPPWSAP